MELTKAKKHWWAMLIRGIVAVIFAILALFWAELTLEILVLLLGVYLLMDAFLSIVAALNAAEHHKRWWLLLVEGLISLAIGIVVLMYPSITLLVLVYIIAFWAILTGLFEFYAAIAAPWVGAGKTFVGVAGIVSIILGIAIIAYPEISLVLMVWFLGLYALVFGLSLIVFSLKIGKEG